MHAAKVKVKDMASTAKEKLREGSAKAEEKAEKATAHTQLEREIAHERAKAKEAEAKEAEAKVELHQEKAEHRAHGITRVPLASHRRHRRPIGSVPAAGTAEPTYPTSGTRPAGEKYV